MAAAWLLNLPESSGSPFTPEEGVPLLLTIGEGSTSNGKLPEAVRVALQGGDYDAGALRLEVLLVDPSGLEVVMASDDFHETPSETELGLFGVNPLEGEELTNPSFSATLFNHSGWYTPGGPSSFWPSGDWAGWALDVMVREFVTDPLGGTLIFRQRLPIAEVTTSHEATLDFATIVAVHPVGGWLSRRWVEDDSTLLDWNGWAHP